jgi:hypothetical protein
MYVKSLYCFVLHSFFMCSVFMACSKSYRHFDYISDTWNGYKNVFQCNVMYVWGYFPCRKTTSTVLVRSGTHCLHVTWAHVMLRVLFGCGRRFNPLNAELNPICHLLALWAHHILHISRIRVNIEFYGADSHVSLCLRHVISRGALVTWAHIKLTFYFQLLPYPFPYVGSLICWSV